MKPVACRWEKKTKVFDLKTGKVISDSVGRNGAVITRLHHNNKWTLLHSLTDKQDME